MGPCFKSESLTDFCCLPVANVVGCGLADELVGSAVGFAGRQLDVVGLKLENSQAPKGNRFDRHGRTIMLLVCLP